MAFKDPLHIHQYFKTQGDLGSWLDELGRRFMKVDLRPLAETMRVEATMFNIDTVQLLRGQIGPVQTIRDRTHMVEPEERMMITVIDRGETIFGCRNTDSPVRPGQICITSSHTTSTMLIPDFDTRMNVLAVPARILRSRIRQLDDLNDRVHIVDPLYFNLLRRYLAFLYSHYQAPDDALSMMSAHMIDMICLILSPTPEATEIVRQGGLMEMRREAVLTYISDHMVEETLSIRQVGENLGLSERYIRVLLETIGTNFSDRLREERLNKAANMLKDPRYKTMRISDIAYEVGFTDLSTFNRAFRNRFGETPKALRGK